MAFDLSGRTALVTGASSGIGAGLAVALAQAGVTVGLSARRADRLEQVLEECRKHSPDSRMWTADIGDPKDVDVLAASALSELGRIDLLVNNAGMPKRRHVTALDPATVDRVMQVNYLGPTRLTLALLPQMIERGDGRIVNISSVAATLSSAGETAYDASKAALAVFSEAMAVDLWDTGVTVMVVYPGVVDTELFQLPDNDPLPEGAVESITVEEAVASIMGGIQSGAIQLYVPEYFAKFAADKAGNIEGFLRGMADFTRSHRPPGA